MAVGFSTERWEAVKENYRKWWDGELDRPLILITFADRDPGRPAPALPFRHFTAFYDLSVSAKEIADVWDYELSRTRFLGDSFPHIWPNFGPGVAAAFLGAGLETGNDTVWFHPSEEVSISRLEFKYDPENVWLRRVKDICLAAVERWEGLVQVGMTDLGGNLDIVSTFRPGERLLLDLFDYPEDVRRTLGEAHKMWWRYFEEINTVLQPVNPGYTAWAPIFSEEPFYMLQCDFCYMISPDMFDEFVKPELEESCRKLANPFYHLDGPGQLPHLDSLLEIKELKGVQWVPGAGAPGVTEWPEVYRKICAAGKLVQTWGDLDTMDTIVSQLGSAEGIIIFATADSEDEAERFLRKYGASDR